MKTIHYKSVSRLKQFSFLIVAITIFVAGCEEGEKPIDPDPDSFRPIIKNNTVYTAKGTPLRGSFIAMDYDFPHDRMITASDIAALKENGLNALHVYVENNYTGRPVGYQAERCDFVVSETRKQGLYTIITIGVINSDDGIFHEEDIRFVMDFWEFYAERYKDYEHVIFEVCNEMPYFEGLTPKVQADAFRIIRKHSPEAMVLFYSLPGTDEIEYIIDTALPALEKEIEGLDWTNEAFAFHGYEGNETSLGPEHFHRVIRDLKQAGYPIINTELPNRLEHTIYTDTKLLNICEEEGISWICFTEYVRVPKRSIWRGRLEAAKIAWTPDFGQWPVTDAVYPFEQHNNTRSIANTGHITFENLYFGERSPLSFTAEVQSKEEGIIYIRKGDKNGKIIGECLIPKSNDSYITCSGFITDYINDFTDITFSYHVSDNADTEEALSVRSWKFDLPNPESYINPYSIIHACQFPYASDNIKRAASTDERSEAPMQVEGISNESELLFDFVLLDNEDMTFHVRAMPVEGGTIEIHWGDFAGIESEIGICEIDGAPGEWNDYSIPLRLHEVLQINGNPSYWDLKLLFKGNSSGELFKISEFYIGN